ncbi:DksA/TraR family C4-type zinc finger protein [Steroidobacter cummioxidans]|uniref:DksA/TraR family C4-type zinc finger protein n=1 Tax=Steroidobacter cummioxidans TaxID=1803913 RepID=UPI000E31B9A1|nr:DksA/TraR family C4-type zinc finger protein [Steroidobacter cummioxidans]
MATGWAGDGAVQDQIDATVKDAVERAKSALPSGPSLTHCADCGVEIPEARRKAIPGVRLCIACQEAEDKEQAAFSGYNRRGSKDSQLR